ncbi:MAG: hypothetical protein PHH60_03335 [Candidatus Margulisbacteria bacterium]|nr:hypothetical protein [Candidatus Margulisiibacteriota bacterium]
MSTFILEILTPDKLLFQGRASALSVKAVDGWLQVLPRHANYMNLLTAGELRLQTEDDTRLKIQHGGGVLEVSKEKVSVLVS